MLMIPSRAFVFAAAVLLAAGAAGSNAADKKAGKVADLHGLERCANATACYRVD